MIALDQATQVIETARLRLRPARAGDEELLFPLFANWDVIRWLSSPPWPYRREDMQSFVRLRKPPEQTDSITRTITYGDALIGSIDALMKPASAVQREDGYSLGYWLGQPYWGRGFMSEAARAFIMLFFATKADDILYSGAFVENVASLRVQEKLGFAQDGRSMSYSRPRHAELPHISTVLTRARFAAATAA